MDTRVRGYDSGGGMTEGSWIPAFAGMTEERV
jgi:hypothetical protein